MATPLEKSTESPSVTEDIDDIDHLETTLLKNEINEGVQSYKLRNGSHLRSKRFDGLSPFLRRLVRKEMLEFEVKNDTSGHQYKVIWDDRVDCFAILTIP